MTPDLVFRDTYRLNFLGLPGAFSERDLESALLRELESFLLELGTDSAFLSRQQRLTIDGRDYYSDLLFFHRRLRRLVAIELKIDEFQASDKGQMELYLRWLAQYEQAPGEEAPLGLILCAGQSTEHVELLQLAESGIRVAEYMLEVPPADVLRAKLHQLIRQAQERAAVASLEQGEASSPAMQRRSAKGMKHAAPDAGAAATKSQESRPMQRKRHERTLRAGRLSGDGRSRHYRHTASCRPTTMAKCVGLRL